MRIRATVPSWPAVRRPSADPVARERLLTAIVVGGIAACFGLLYLWSSEVLATKWIVVTQVGLALVALAIASGRFERVLFTAMMTLLPINPDIYWHPTPEPPKGTQLIGCSVIEVLLLGLYIAWFIRLPTERPSFRKLWPSGAWALLATIGWAALSTLNARYPQYSYYMIFALLKSFLWFFYIAYHVRTREDVRLIVICLSIGLLLESAFAFAQHISGRPLGLGAFGERERVKEVELEASNVFRVGGTLGHPNSLGGYVAAVLPVMMAMSLASVGKRLRMLMLGASAAGALTLVLTYSRSAWLAGFLAFVVLVLWLLADRSRRGRVMPIVVVGTVLCVVLAGFLPLIKARWTEDDSGSTVSRFSQFRMAFEMIKAHPWLGLGLNHYVTLSNLYETYVDDDKRGMVFIHTGRVHNVFLLTAAESGVPTLIFLGLFVLIVTYHGWRAISRSDDELVRFALMGVLLGFYSRLLHDGFHTGNLCDNPFLWVFPAILVAGPRLLPAPPARAQEQISA